jgi:hypothetical protein
MLEFLTPPELALIREGIRYQSSDWEHIHCDFVKDNLGYPSTLRQSKVTGFAFKIDAGYLKHTKYEKSLVTTRTIMLDEDVRPVMLARWKVGVVICCDDTSEWLMDWLGLITPIHLVPGRKSHGEYPMPYTIVAPEPSRLTRLTEWLWSFWG